MRTKVLSITASQPKFLGPSRESAATGHWTRPRQRRTLGSMSTWDTAPKCELMRTVAISFHIGLFRRIIRPVGNIPTQVKWTKVYQSNHSQKNAKMLETWATELKHDDLPFFSRQTAWNNLQYKPGSEKSAIRPSGRAIKSSNSSAGVDGCLTLANWCQLLPFLLMAIKALGAKPWGCLMNTLSANHHSSSVGHPWRAKRHRTARKSSLTWWQLEAQRHRPGITRTVSNMSSHHAVADPTCSVSPSPGDTTWPDSWDTQMVFWYSTSTANYKDVFPGDVPRWSLATTYHTWKPQNLPARLTILMRRLKRNKRSIMGSSGKAAAVILSCPGIWKISMIRTSCWDFLAASFTFHKAGRDVLLFQCHKDST